MLWISFVFNILCRPGAGAADFFDGENIRPRLCSDVFPCHITSAAASAAAIRRGEALIVRVVKFRRATALCIRPPERKQQLPANGPGRGRGAYNHSWMAGFSG